MMDVGTIIGHAVILVEEMEIRRKVSRLPDSTVAPHRWAPFIHMGA
jgi:hypothetical protein